MKQVSTFQERLKEAIGDMSYSELGSKIGLSKQAIGAYMTGVRVPKRPTLEALAAVLNVNPAWLYGLDAPMRSQSFTSKDAINSFPAVHTGRFKDRINLALKERQVNPPELSRMTGISERAITQYRVGVYEATQRDLEKLANALGVSVAWLMGADVPMEVIPASEIKRVPPPPSVRERKYGRICAVDPEIFAEGVLKAITEDLAKLTLNGQAEAALRVNELTLNPKYQATPQEED